MYTTPLSKTHSLDQFLKVISKLRATPEGFESKHHSYTAEEINRKLKEIVRNNLRGHPLSPIKLRSETGFAVWNELNRLNIRMKGLFLD
jgi:hypothetical protein